MNIRLQLHWLVKNLNSCSLHRIISSFNRISINRLSRVSRANSSLGEPIIKRIYLTSLFKTIECLISSRTLKSISNSSNLPTVISMISNINSLLDLLLRWSSLPSIIWWVLPIINRTSLSEDHRLRPTLIKILGLFSLLIIQSSSRLISLSSNSSLSISSSLSLNISSSISSNSLSSSKRIVFTIIIIRLVIIIHRSIINHPIWMVWMVAVWIWIPLIPLVIIIPLIPIINYLVDLLIQLLITVIISNSLIKCSLLPMVFNHSHRW